MVGFDAPLGAGRGHVEGHLDEGVLAALGDGVVHVELHDDLVLCGEGDGGDVLGGHLEGILAIDGEGEGAAVESHLTPVAAVELHFPPGELNVEVRGAELLDGGDIGAGEALEAQRVRALASHGDDDAARRARVGHRLDVLRGDVHGATAAGLLPADPGRADLHRALDGHAAPDE